MLISAVRVMMLIGVECEVEVKLTINDLLWKPYILFRDVSLLSRMSFIAIFCSDIVLICSGCMWGSFLPAVICRACAVGIYRV